MITWWLEKLGQFYREIKHNAREDIQHADCLSKVHPEEEDTTVFIAASTFEENVQEQPRNLGYYGYYSRTRTLEIFRKSSKRIKTWRESSQRSMINSALTDGACLRRLNKYGSIGSISRISVSWMEIFIGKETGNVRNCCAAANCC